jgi:SdrD B-like domain
MDGVFAAQFTSGKTKSNYNPPAGLKYELVDETNWYYPYVCDSQNVAPIEFDIPIPQGTYGNGATLTLYTYWVEQGEYAVVYLNSQYLGLLQPTGTQQEGSTTFTLPTDYQAVVPGKANRVTIQLKDGACTDVTGGTIHLVSPRGTIRGLLFVDENRNGIYDEGEAGYQGAKVHFFVEGREVVAPALFSGDDGTYGLVAAEWGDWMVSIDVPEGYVPTSPTAQEFHWEGIDAFVGVNFGIAVPLPATATPTVVPTATPE